VFNLNGQVVLVTGGNTGLGLGMAKGLVKAGAKVAIWGRNQQRNQLAVEELTKLGGDVASFACDVTRPEQVDEAMARTLERFGQLDSCFANAGGTGARGTLLSQTTEDWQQTMNLNFHSVISTFRAAAKHMIARGEGGRLIATASIAARMGLPGGGYAASKSAVSGLVRSLAMELGRAGITVNAILPGFIETEMSLDTPEIFREAGGRRKAVNKLGTVADMEGIAVFLASPHARLMTGESIGFDGGYSIYPF